MAIKIRPADLEIDRQILIESLYQYLTTQSDAQRFDWLYQQNPYGPARVWVACEESSGEVIGTAAAFPRDMWVEDNNRRCWVLGDFCVRDDFRSLGPALLLQRACLSAVACEDIPFCYDYPSTSMMAIYRRVGMSAVGLMQRFVKLLRVDHKVQEILGSGRLTRGVSTISNRVLAWKDALGGGVKGCDIALHTGAFGEEFSDLEQRLLPSQRGVCGRRTAAYLNWRYGQNPLRGYQVMTARRGGELHAYVVWTQEAQHHMLTDIVGGEAPAVLEELCAAVIAVVRAQGGLTVSASLLNAPWLIACLERVGFQPREERPVMAYTRADGPFAHVVTTPQYWFLSDGDRDM